MDELIESLISKESNSSTEYSDKEDDFEIVSFTEGQTFNSHQEFKNKFDIWCPQNNHPMKTDSSVKHDDKTEKKILFRKLGLRVNMPVNQKLEVVEYVRSRRTCHVNAQYLYGSNLM